MKVGDKVKWSSAKQMSGWILSTSKEAVVIDIDSVGWLDKGRATVLYANIIGGSVMPGEYVDFVQHYVVSGTVVRVYPSSVAVTLDLLPSLEVLLDNNQIIA